MGAVIAVACSTGVLSRWVGYHPLRLTALLFAIGFIVVRPLRSFGLIVRERFLALFMAFTVASLAWSPDTSVAIADISAIIGTLLLGLALAAWFTPKQAAAIIFWTLASISYLSAALVAFLPSVGKILTSRIGNELIELPVGLFAWNSELGIVAAIAAVLAAWAFTQTKRLRWLAAMASLFGIALYSTSVTAVFAAAAGIGLIFAVSFKRARQLTVALVVILAILWLTRITTAESVSGFLAAFDRSSDLTGRTTIWQVYLDEGARHPVIGTGIGGTSGFTAALGHDLHAHNGFIQVYAELGLVGLGLLLAALGAALLRMGRAHDILGFALLATIVVMNLANNLILNPTVCAVVLGWTVFSSATSVYADGHGGPRPIEEPDQTRGQPTDELATTRLGLGHMARRAR